MNTFGIGNVTNRKPDPRSPLPIIWPEKYEDTYFPPLGDDMVTVVTRGIADPKPMEVDGIKGEGIEIRAKNIRNVIPGGFPRWRHMLEEQEQMRQQLRDGVIPFHAQERNPHFQSFGTFDPSLAVATPAAFDIHNMHHFNALHSVAEWREKHLNSLVDWRIIRNEEMLYTANSELMHTLYHLSMWRAEGRRVYVLDETLYTMLAHTELPSLPLDMLSFRQHSFYVKLPSKAFQFAVPNYLSGGTDIEYVEGVMVGISETQPDTGKQREAYFIVCGDGSSQAEAANIAYISAGFGPDGKMCDVRFNEGTGYAPNGEEGLREIMPRVILGLCLYMQCEHPDLEPVPPPPKRDLAAVKSNRKKAKLVRRINGHSKLGYIYVGRRVAEIEAHEFQKRLTIVGTRGHKLEKPVWVSGHWRQQPVGAGRRERRMVWIRPYRKGPDFDESLKIRAAKVQPARHKQ